MTDERIISRHHPIYHQAVRVLITVKPLQVSLVVGFISILYFLLMSTIVDRELLFINLRN